VTATRLHPTPTSHAAHVAAGAMCDAWRQAVREERMRGRELMECPTALLAELARIAVNATYGMENAA
jgi:hypothetical protein